MNRHVSPPAEERPRRLPGLDAAARRILLGMLPNLETGRLVLEEAGTRHRFGRTDGDPALAATVRVLSPSFYGSVLTGGSVGAAESYMRGEWEADDLPTVVRILVRNLDVLEEMETGLARLAEPANRLYHLLRRNTRAGSRKNIVAHYDLGNAFFSLFLDESMAYSNALFEREDSTLSEASVAKFDRICRKLSLGPGHRVLEIGCGWGGFAIHAAGNYGCAVTAVTISNEQANLATRRVREAGLEERVEVVRRDYRDLTGVYDRLVSIEMIEAVGHDHLGTFFRCCSDLLAPDGLMGLQAITIRDQVFERHARSVDFIKRYIFPGSCIPSLEIMLRHVARRTDLRLVHLEDITPHYVRTLRCWRSRFRENVDRVRAQGFPEAFVRMWEYYLCYCEGSFAERYNGDVQMILAKPLCRSAPILGSL